jgi:ribosomal protein L13
MAPTKKSVVASEAVSGGGSASGASSAASTSAVDLSAASNVPVNPKLTNTNPSPFLNSLDLTKLEYVMKATHASEFDFDRLVIGFPVPGADPSGNKFFRAITGYVHTDSKGVHRYGPAIFSLGRKNAGKYSYGVQADNVDAGGKVKVVNGEELKLTGYKMPLIMEAKGGATEHEKEEVQFFEQFQDRIFKWACANKKLIGMSGKSDPIVEDKIKKLLFYSKDQNTQAVIEGKSPTFYCPLAYYPKDNKCGTTFYGPKNVTIDPLTVKTPFRAWPTVRITSIFCNAKTIAPQVKTHDATVELITRGPQTRLAPDDVLAEPTSDSDSEEAEGGGGGALANDSDAE